MTAETTGYAPFSTLKNSISVGSTLLSDVDGLGKTFAWGKSAIDTYGACIAPVSEGFTALANCFKTANDITAPFQFFKTAKEWYDVPNKTWAGTATLVCATGLTVFGVSKFLEKVKLLNLGALVTQIGSIPVIGLILEIPVVALVIGVSVFNIADTGIKLNKGIKFDKKFDDLEKSRWQYKKWKARKDAFAGINGATLDTLKPREAGGEAWSKSRYDDFTQGAASDNEAATKYLDYKVRKWKTILSNNQIEKNKSIMSIVIDVSKIALTILGLVGSYIASAFAVTWFATATAAPMLVCGFTVASMALCKKIYDTTYKEPSKVPVEPENVKNFREIYLRRNSLEDDAKHAPSNEYGYIRQ